jgi:N12 class adenine-specific DNA methylase
MAYNQLQKLTGNIQAIRIALDREAGVQPGPEEVAALKSYAGFGGIKAILFPNGPIEEWERMGASKEDLRMYPSIMELHKLLQDKLSETDYKQTIDSIKHSVLTAFYTPEVIPQVLYEVLKVRDIRPAYLYEPSAGAGVFLTEALKTFEGLQGITAVEKDLLTGRILQAVCSTMTVASKVHIAGFEETPVNDTGKYDLVVSNIPFGNFSVYDAAIRDKALSGKIHNYFFAKGLDKLANGGLLAYITTDAFLNSLSNLEARKYLFDHADFISLAVMPDNLMKDTGNTEAPSHLLIVQKRSGKTELNNGEELLLQSVKRSNENGDYHINSYIAGAGNDYLYMGLPVPGQNQYGQANTSVQAFADPTVFRTKLAEQLEVDFYARFNQEAFKNAQLSIAIDTAGQNKQFTFLAVPEDTVESSQVQLGLFDTAFAANTNRALAYLDDKDKGFVNKQTARIISTIRTSHQPAHESMVLLSAQTNNGNRYVYKLYSNVAELHFSANWMNAADLNPVLEKLSAELRSYSYQYRYEGDKTLESTFGLERHSPELFTAIKPYYKEGTLVHAFDKTGKLGPVDHENKVAGFTPLGNQNNRPFFLHYISLRDRYLDLTTKISAPPADEGEREQLNKAYDYFTDAFGKLNFPANKRLINEDSAFGLQMLSSLERRDGDNYIKADVLLESLAVQEQHFTTDDPVEALARSLNDRGKVDIGYIEAATGLSDAEVIQQLEQHIFLNPQDRQWETVDQYLSGNVVEKLAMAKIHAEKEPGNIQFQRSLETITKIQPEKIPFELLDFNLGERWLPLNFYQTFADELFETSAAINYFPSLDSFKVTISGFNAKVTQEYAVKPKSGNAMLGHTLLEHALENTAPFFTYEIDMGDKKVRVPDNEAIQLAHQKIENIRNRFVEWLQELPVEDKKELEQTYNDMFNCYVLREYDGSHLTFPGLELKALGIEELHSSQRNGTWRIIQNRGALIDHEVGLGKTLIIILAAQEMKRLGIVHKPMILALKANVDQIRNTYRKAYPKAKILAPGENDFTPDKRLRLLHEIKNNNWDCIILTHDQFGKIPQSPEIQREIFQSELDNVERDLETLAELGGELSRKMLKGLEIRKNNLEGNLKSALAAIEEKKDSGIDFNELGVDHLFIDESHKFKNLTFTTRHNRVAGLGNMEGSQKALNMLFAVRTLQQRFDADLCVTFLSGTPISNSLTEMYLIFKYLRPKEMERQRIENFDGWAAVFARKTTDFEFSVTNEIISKERFRHFIKVPELALFYNGITDYKTAAHIKLDKPEMDEVLVNIKPTPDQQEFTKKLMAFARSGDAALIGRPTLSKSEDKARMLIATNYAKKMAVDMRLVDESYADHPESKVNVCARNVAALYKESAAHKGTQIIFCDIGTPGTNGFNLYAALKDKLVNDFKLPAHEIAFIHDWQGKKKSELFRKMNSGEIRALVGSTEMAGTGLNVQERVIASHHLDIPWTPKDLEQRNGRGARQGNLIAKLHYNNKVKNFIYGTEQSLDNYKFNLLKNKQLFISQMKNCELNVRTIDEGAYDEKSGMNFSEYIAILSGDTSLLEKSKLEKKVAVVESLKKAHFKELLQAKYRLERLKSEKETTEQTAGQLKQDESIYKEQLRFDKEGSKENSIRITGLNSADAEVIGKQVISLYHNWKPAEEPKIGSLYGFDLYIRRHHETEWVDGKSVDHQYNTFYAQHPQGEIKYTYNQGHPNVDNPKLAARHFLNAIDRVSSLREKYEKNLSELDKDIPMVEQILLKPFEKETELAEMKTRLASLEREIALKIQEKRMKELEQPVEGTQEDIAETVPVMVLQPKAAQIMEMKNNLSGVQIKEAPARRSRGMRF